MLNRSTILNRNLSMLNEILSLLKPVGLVTRPICPGSICHHGTPCGPMWIPKGPYGPIKMFAIPYGPIWASDMGPGGGVYFSGPNYGHHTMQLLPHLSFFSRGFIQHLRFEDAYAYRQVSTQGNTGLHKLQQRPTTILLGVIQ